MPRRAFLKSLISAVTTLILAATAGKSVAALQRKNQKILLQTSSVAGYQFYDGDRIWDLLQPGDTIKLINEPDNIHDNRAVKVMWGENKLGYVPSQDNATISQMISRKEPLTAEISELKMSNDPWNRVAINIYYDAKSSIYI